MTKERKEFVKKYCSRYDICHYEMESDLTALIESEVARKKEPFERPFKIEKSMYDYHFVKDANDKNISIGFLKEEHAQWLCDRLNRE